MGTLLISQKFNAINYLNVFILIFAIWIIIKPVHSSGFSSRDLNFPELNLTQWNKNVTYSSSTEYHPRGMMPFYNLTHRILDLFYEDEAIPDGMLIINRKKNKSFKD